MIGIPQFCRNEDLLTGNTALMYRGAHALFIAVHRCRIDVPVARLESCQHRCLASRPGARLPHTQPELRNKPPVVERNFALDHQGRLHENGSAKLILSWRRADAPGPLDQIGEQLANQFFRRLVLEVSR